MTTTDAKQVDALVEEHYDVLKQIARARRRRGSRDKTLLTTDLLHESWLKLRKQSEWNDEKHFLRTAAVAMRQVVIDYARRKHRVRRGAGERNVSFDDAEPFLPEFSETPEQLVEIGDVLEKLGDVNPRLLAVVDLRYFAGFTEAEAAMTLGVTDRTVRRDWQTAKAWLAAELSVPL